MLELFWMWVEVDKKSRKMAEILEILDVQCGTSKNDFLRYRQGYLSDILVAINQGLIHVFGPISFAALLSMRSRAPFIFQHT